MSKKTHLNRKMETRHIRMISLGGVIGTGLFLSSGYTIHQAGAKVLDYKNDTAAAIPQIKASDER